MPNIFFISDTHLGHAKSLEFKREDGSPMREFSSVEEMNEVIVDNWNKTVRPNDIVYHLGDVFFHQGHQHLSRLKGRKMLVVGNHDNLVYKGRPSLLFHHFEKVELWRAMNKHGILASHVPVSTTQIREGYTNVHGHVHHRTLDDKRYLNVSVENINYTPISIEDVKTIIAARK